MRPSNKLENKIPSDTYWRIQLVCMKVHAHFSLEPTLEYNLDQMPFWGQKKIILLFPEKWVTKKIFTRAAAKKIFYQFNWIFKKKFALFWLGKYFQYKPRKIFLLEIF